MISSIELVDFISHSTTKLEFSKGVTIFVGHNGAGKSSIIDGITFSLFGKHTRKSNKSLIRYGANQGYAKVCFTKNGKNYNAERKIDSRGNLSSIFSEIKDDEEFQIVSGERKQFGESMSSEVEKRIGLDFEKLKIASIVQQGELNSIINAKPKEFKELLNAIIGIDKLDIAAEAMKIIKKEFREKIKNSIGYDDTHIDILVRDLEKNQKDVQESAPLKIKLEKEQREVQQELEQIRKKIDLESPKIDKINQLKNREKELFDYAKETIQEIQQEIIKNERKISDCEGCFEISTQKAEFELKIKKVEEAIEVTRKNIQDMTNETTSLKEKLILAEKLQLKNNKCPVCNSNVEKLNPIFQKEHINEEIKSLQEKIKAKNNEKEVYDEKLKKFSEKLRNSTNAETTLKAHGINNKEELIKIKEEIIQEKQKIPLNSNYSLQEISEIDSHAKRIFDNINVLNKEIKDFDEKEFLDLKNLVEIKQRKLSQIDQQLGAINEKISNAEKEIEEIEKASEEVRIVKNYLTEIEEIETNIFNRDGPVATSLRSWALNTIAIKTSEYLELLNTKIQRIQLKEKTREISITCFAKNEILDLESLSGGERVSIALALRLGMASLLGASNLNLMILDEPTTHLDTERKKSLVGVLSQLSNISNSESEMQFLIITHDAEIFEDATVERIYKFESNKEGSNVIAL